MLTFDEARSRLLSGIRPLPSERVPLHDAADRVLAEDLVAREPLPPFDYSAMDGYAVRVADLTGNPPWDFPVVGESSAGIEPPRLASGSVCRIFTGAGMPRDADAVLTQESVTREADRIRIEERPRRGQNVRRAGEDLGRNAIAIASGTRLSAGVLALAGMIDQAELGVARRPRVTILCTGNELRAPGSEGPPATIPESNSAPLAVLARQAGAHVCVAPIVRDEPRAVDRALETALDATDVLVTVGGVSVGDHDVVRPALERAGVTLDFWRVAIKPGKPLVVGRRSGAYVLGLPGNPASAIVTFTLFGIPLLRALQGDAHPLASALRIRLAAARKRSPDRLEFVRASLRPIDGASAVIAHDNQSSGAATSLASSEGVAFVPPGDAPIPAGALVDFLRWVDA